MTVSSENKRNSYSCNGSQVDFPYTFRILDETHLKVLLVDSVGASTELTLTTHYTVSGVGDASGGTVTTVATYSSDYTLVILRNVPITQLLDYVEFDEFPAQQHEDGLDKLTMIIQSLTEEVGRCLKVPASSDLSETDLEISPSPSKAIGWDGDGDELTNYDTTTLTAVDFANLYEDYSNDLATAVSDIASVGKTVVVDRDTAVDDDLTIPQNIRLFIINQANISIASGKTLTIYSPWNIMAGNYQVFTGSGSIAWTDNNGLFKEAWDASGSGAVLYLDDGIKFNTGAYLKELSTDGTLAGNSDNAAVAESALVTALATALAGSNPVGSVKIWFGETPPTGYLELDGSAISRTTYADLFALWGTNFGVGDGSTTFNIPDLRGEGLRGWDHGAGRDPDAASRNNRGDGTTGDHVGTWQNDMFQSHGHAGSTSANESSHTHPLPSYDAFAATHNLLGLWADSSSNPDVTGSGSAHNHTINVAAQGGNETRMLNMAVMFCVKY